ncbi:MAG: GntR family transcriptional regulator [Planctomycetes bacterium]|nr:GntR family transcriptional regulator [Planctomycetota bacterium]
MPDVFSDFKPQLRLSPGDQITSFLREQVLSGALAPGCRLPTTQELARRWGVTITVIQAAVAPLVKEGLLLRRPRVGTVVRERTAKLGRIGLYRITDAAREDRDHFSRSLSNRLTSRIQATGGSAVVYPDLRPEAERTLAFPALLAAVRTGQLDAVIACESEHRTNLWIAKLPVPTAIHGADPMPNAVWQDYAQFARDGLGCLAARGCRTVGLISTLPDNESYPDGSPHLTRSLRDTFVAHAQSIGLATAAPWIRSPEVMYIAETDAERFGYDCVRAMWAAGAPPDGLLVFTDLAARGVIMGLLSSAGARMPALALHRNAEIGLFCPMPADFLEVSIEATAGALSRCVERQRLGEAVHWTLLPFRVVAGPGGAAP